MWPDYVGFPMELEMGKRGVEKEEKFPRSRKPSHKQVCESFGISEGNITERGKKKKRKKPHRISLTTTSSREVAQMLASATSE